MAPAYPNPRTRQGFYLRRVRLLMSGTLVEKVGWTVTLEGTNSSFLRRTRRGADVTFERRAYHLAAEFESERLDDGRKRDGYCLLGSVRLYPKTARPSFHHLEFGSRVGRITGDQPSGQWELAANYYVQQDVRFMCDYIVNSNPAPGAARQSLHARADIRS